MIMIISKAFLGMFLFDIAGAYLLNLLIGGFHFIKRKLNDFWRFVNKPL